MTKNLKGFVEILIVVLLAVVGIWIVGSFIVGPSFVIPTPTTESTPNPTENLPRDEDLRIWKTYRNEEYGFETKYPPSWFILPSSQITSFFSTDPNNGGNLSGFQISIISNENHLSPKDWWFDQNQPLTEYNQQRYDQFTDIIINELKGIKIMPDARPEGIALTEVYLVNNQWIYQISMSDDEYKPNLNEKQINDQILSTFRFLQTDDSWKTYSNSQYRFEVKYDPQSPPQENTSNETAGQFTYQLLVNFGTNPIKFPHGYILRITSQSLEDYKTELIGHNTDKIDSQVNYTINGNTWTKLNYQIFLTTDYVPITTAIINHSNLSYSITAGSEDINQILSSFRFLNEENIPRECYVDNDCSQGICEFIRTCGVPDEMCGNPGKYSCMKRCSSQNDCPSYQNCSDITRKDKSSVKVCVSAVPRAQLY